MSSGAVDISRAFLRLLHLDRGGFAQPGHLLLQCATTLFKGFIRALGAGQRILQGLQGLSLLRQ